MSQMERRHQYRKWAAYAGVAVCTIFIWRNSLVPATQSAAQSLSVMERLTALLEWLGLPVTVGHTLLRKMAHMSEFALLGVLWETALVTGTKGRKSWHCVQSACTLCLLTAMVDETIQVFVPGRGSQVTDVWIDFAGACLGVAIAAVLGWFLRRRRSSRAW